MSVSDFFAAVAQVPASTIYADVIATVVAVERVFQASRGRGETAKRAFRAVRAAVAAFVAPEDPAALADAHFVTAVPVASAPSAPPAGSPTQVPPSAPNA